MIPMPTPENMRLATCRRSSPAAVSTSADTAIIAHPLAAPPMARRMAHPLADVVMAIAAVVTVLATRPRRTVARSPSERHSQLALERAGDVAQVVAAGDPARRRRRQAGGVAHVGQQRRVREAPDAHRHDEDEGPAERRPARRMSGVCQGAVSLPEL